MKEYILVLDSGIGGVSILNECIKLLPNEHFLYVADNKNAPYGNSSKLKLNKLSFDLIKKLKKEYKIKLIVIACNTLTATSIAFLRKKFKVKFVGVEPAIKPALKFSNKVLVLSTVATLKYNKNMKAIKKQKTKGVKFLTFTNLAKAIDDNIDSLHKLESLVDSLLLNYKNKTDLVVLGCTHYVFINDLIKKTLNNVKVLDSGVSVAKQVARLNKKNTFNKKGSVTVLLTKKDNNLQKKILKLVYKIN